MQQIYDPVEHLSVLFMVVAVAFIMLCLGNLVFPVARRLSKGRTQEEGLPKVSKNRTVKDVLHETVTEITSGSATYKDPLLPSLHIMMPVSDANPELGPLLALCLYCIVATRYPINATVVILSSCFNCFSLGSGNRCDVPR